jgi:hypothetical protein
MTKCSYCNEITWLAHWKEKKNYIMDTLQNLDAHEITPLSKHFSIWKGDNICHHIWDKDELIYDGCWEHIGNMRKC